MAIELQHSSSTNNAQQPYLSEESVKLHYGKHHSVYMEKLKGHIPDAEFEQKTLQEIVKSPSSIMFHHAAQVWNHTFYWNCLSPSGGGDVKGKVADAIKINFGSFQAFKEDFNNSAIANFGSGWTWLVQDAEGSLAIINTGDAATPLTDPTITPILAVDVGEHAYYMDDHYTRPQYLQAFWHLVNWDFVNTNLQ